MAITYIGATPVFCDINPETYLIDLNDAKKRIDTKVKAIIGVNLYGDALNNFARKYNLTFIEDTAQAHGALYNGKRIGSTGNTTCFSFYPTKNLCAYDEAGALLTDDDKIACRVRLLRNHGQQARSIHEEIGYNYRIDGIQELIFNCKLPCLDTWNTMRKRTAQEYSQSLKNLPLLIPKLEGTDVYHLYVIQTNTIP